MQLSKTTTQRNGVIKISKLLVLINNFSIEKYWIPAKNRIIREDVLKQVTVKIEINVFDLKECYKKCFGANWLSFIKLLI